MEALLKDVQLEQNLQEMISCNAPGNTFFKVSKKIKNSLPENLMFASNILLIVANRDVKFLLFK